LVLLGHSRGAEAQTLAGADRDLVVATKEAPPFAIKQKDGSWSGISVELWRKIAEREHLRYHFVEQPTVKALLDGTTESSFDAAVAALTVTAAREQKVEFTQPFYSTGLGVAVPVTENAWVSIGRALLSFGFFQAVAALLVIAFCVGCVIWAIERRRTEHFGGGAKGFGTSLWWSTAAMTQAGATQHAPTTLPGRLVATAWMIASVIALSVFTAGVTSTLTRRELQGAVHSVGDLHSVRVGAVANSTSMDYLDRQQIAHQVFPDAQDGLRALQAGAIDAFVYDKPLLTWNVLQDFSRTLRVLDFSFDSQTYAIALPKGSPLRERLDLAVLDKIESDWWQQELFKYLGQGQLK
jgi:ABC-type amino acid transport substrate-binding protein